MLLAASMRHEGNLYRNYCVSRRCSAVKLSSKLVYAGSRRGIHGAARPAGRSFGQYPHRPQPRPGFHLHRHRPCAALVDPPPIRPGKTGSCPTTPRCALNSREYRLRSAWNKFLENAGVCVSEYTSPPSVHSFFDVSPARSWKKLQCGIAKSSLILMSSDLRTGVSFSHRNGINYVCISNQHKKPIVLRRVCRSVSSSSRVCSLKASTPSAPPSSASLKYLHSRLRYPPYQ